MRSSTGLKAYEACPEQYRAEYREQRPVLPGPEALTGTLCHAVLESLARSRILAGSNAPAGIEELCEALGACAVEVGDPGALARARRVLIASEGIDLAEGGELLAVEEDLSAEIGGVEWSGRLDLLRRGADGALEAIDWKTGERPLTQDEADGDAQASLYLVLLREWALAAGEEETPLRFVLRYLATGDRVVVTWTPQLDRETRARCRAAAHGIEAEAFRARPGSACVVCPVRSTCESCWSAAGSAVDDAPEILRGLSASHLLSERQRLKDAEDVAATARKDVDAEIMRRVAEGGRPIQAGGYTASVATRAKPSYAPELLPELAAELGEDPLDLLRRIGSLRGVEVDRLVKAEPTGELRKVASKYCSRYEIEYVTLRRRRGPF